MKLNFIILCDNAYIEDGKPNFKGVFYKFSVDSIPAKYENMDLVVEFLLDDNNEHELEISITNSNGGKAIQSFTKKIKSGDKDFFFGQIVHIKK